MKETTMAVTEGADRNTERGNDDDDAGWQTQKPVDGEAMGHGCGDHEADASDSHDPERSLNADAKPPATLGGQAATDEEDVAMRTQTETVDTGNGQSQGDDGPSKQEGSGSEVRVTGAQQDENQNGKSEFDKIAKDTAPVLENYLKRTRFWTKKLLAAITVYVKDLEQVDMQYSKIQELEHDEADRLDQVEPDVRGATSHLLDNRFMAVSRGHGTRPYDHGGQTESPGPKRAKPNRS